MFYDLTNPLQAQNFKERCRALYKKKCIVELTERKPQRTLAQNSYLHAALGFFALETGYSLEEVKKWFFKQEVNPDMFIRKKRDSITGKERAYLRSSKDLSTEEMTVAIEKFRNWAVTVPDPPVYIPSPEEHRLVEQMQIEVRRGAKYL